MPLGFVVSIMSFYFHAGYLLGWLPGYNNPDPKELAIYGIYSPFVEWTLNLWGWSILIWMILLLII